MPITMLPAIVGMGVVSRATDTMFGRREKGKVKTKVKSRKPKVCKGPRGGKYIMRKGRKVYV